MKLLVMCPRFPYPLEKGDKLRMFHQLRYLGQSYEVLLVAITEEEVKQEYIDKLKTYVSDVKVFQLPKYRRVLALMNSVFSKMPFQVSYYYNKSIARQIAKAANNFKPDHIYCQLTRMSEYAKGLPFSKTIDYMDAFGVGMSRRAEVVSGIYAAIYRMEAKRMKAYEVSIYDTFDHHTIISDQDAKQVSENSIHTIPNGIDTDFFTPLDQEKKYTIGFVGNMGYAPNIDAAEYLVKKILPLLPSNTETIIAGARPDKRVKQLATSNVKITGWLDDVRTAYAESRIFVAPLWLGTGQQNKILEAMAMGIPCVTSTVVNNAIGAKVGEEILVADNEQEFADCIIRLSNDPSLYADIRRNALTFVQTNYSWKKSVDSLKKLLEA